VRQRQHRAGHGRAPVGAALLALAMIAAPGAQAADEEAVPYWASIDAPTANARTGPQIGYEIRWVYRRQDLPVKVTKRFGVWRRVVDPDGDESWIHANLLSRTRTAIVTGEVQPMRAEPRPRATLLWRVAPGVVGRLGECARGWCELAVDKRKGWVAESALWGTGEP